MKKKIVLFGNEKGGVGKTTCSVSVAAALAGDGLRVLLVDTDPNSNTTKWIQHRDESATHIDSCKLIGHMGKQLTAMAENYDVTVVDAGGRDSVELRQAALVADLWLVPMAATHVELWTLETALEACTSIEAVTGDKPPALVLINKVDTLPSIQSANELNDALLAHEYYAKYLPPCPVRLSHLRDFDHGFGLGLGVTEYKPQSRAAKEVQELAAYIKNFLLGIENVEQ